MVSVESGKDLTFFSAVFIVGCRVMWSEMVDSVPIPNSETAGQDVFPEKVLRVDV